MISDTYIPNYYYTIKNPETGKVKYSFRVSNASIYFLNLEQFLLIDHSFLTLNLIFTCTG